MMRAWTRRSRIERLNRNVLSKLPLWSAEDLVRHHAAAERRAASVAELADEPSDP